MVKDFDQLVEESKGRDLEAELAESREQMKRGEGKRTVVTVTEDQPFKLDYISEKDIARHADVDGKVRDNG